MCQPGSHAVPDFVAFGAGAVKEVRSTALLCVLIAGPLDFTGSLAFVLDDFPVALGAGPVNTGWGGKYLFLGAAPLMEDARDCCVERLIAEFASEVGFSRAVASEFVSIAELAGCEYLLANATGLVFEIRFLVRLGLRGAKEFVFGVFTSVLEDASALTAGLCIRLC